MEIKKSPKASLENKKLLFTEIGFALALLICLVAFEWKTYEKSVSLLDTSTEIATEEEMVPFLSPGKNCPRRPKSPKFP